jgi:hypothetical protein
MDFDEYRKIAMAHLKRYKDRYNFYHPGLDESYPSYSGFSAWAEKHRKSCGDFESELLDKFLRWLSIKNSRHQSAIMALADSNLEEFFSTLVPRAVLESRPSFL